MYLIPQCLFLLDQRLQHTSGFLARLLKLQHCSALGLEFGLGLEDTVQVKDYAAFVLNGGFLLNIGGMLGLLLEEGGVKLQRLGQDLVQAT